MKKTQTPFEEIAAIDRELFEFAPRIRQGFERLGGPSARVERAIREEAQRMAASRRARLAWPLGRILAVAASLALLLGGAAFWFASQHAEKETQGLAQQPAAAARVDESTASFASLLMEIQGLNEDGFFRTEEAESLWL